MIRLGRSLLRLPSAALLLAAAACGGDPPTEPDDSRTIARGTGNGQTAQVGTALGAPLVVRVTDGEGDPVAGVSITWATASGGSFAAATSQTNAQGEAQGSWTLGATVGAQTATASLQDADGSPVTFTATATAAPGGSDGTLAITSVGPSPLVMGQAATLTGTGLGTSTTEIRVVVDEDTAVVTAASATSLTFTVPDVCKPVRSGEIKVLRSGSSSNALNEQIVPSASVAMAVGAQEILPPGPRACLQFAAGTSAEDYLIGVQSTSETVSSLTPVELVALTDGTSVPPLGTPSMRARMVSALRQPAALRAAADARRDRLSAHRAGEQRIRDAEARLFRRGLSRVATRPGMAPSLRPGASRVPGTVEVGDMVAMSVPSYITGSGCTAIGVTAVVRAVGAKGIWLEDTSNPAGGFTPEEYAELSAALDDTIYPTVTGHFGEPTDLDENGRIQVLVTKEVNRMGNVLGFVSSTDLFSRASCASSNEGETYYSVAPDPTGTYPLGEYPSSVALAGAPGLISHEFTHIVQQSRRLYVVGGDQMARWTSEGQATMAEEVVGFAVEGHTSGENLGFLPAFNEDDPASTDWYQNRFVDLATYYGYSGTPTKTPGAPSECSWLDQAPANPGPCIGGRDVYGTPWSLLRYLSDQYGPAFVGGEAGLQQAIINSDQVGYANLEDVVSVPIRTLLARWSAALYMDDRTATVDPSLQLTSWDLYDIFDANLVPTAHLVPTSFGFGTTAGQAQVRAGSTAYFRLSGTGRPATAVRVGGLDDTALPGHMQVYVVRIR